MWEEWVNTLLWAIQGLPDKTAAESWGGQDTEAVGIWPSLLSSIIYISNDLSASPSHDVQHGTAYVDT